MSVTTSYTASVANATSSIIVTATRSDVNAAAVVSNAAGVCAQNRCALAVGTNRITTTVTAQDGATRKSYVVTVTRAASSNADLSGLALSAGALTPAFVSVTTSYTASVGNGVSTVTITGTKSDVNATVVVSNAAGVCASNRCALVVGTNRITAMVTAQDGVTRKSYVVTVTRAGSSNADLSGLALSAGALTPAFVSATTSYTASVANATSSIIVTATRSDVNATVVVSNASGVCAQNRCALAVGTNRITTTVTAQDGVTRKSYVVTVMRAASRVEALSELVSSHAIPQR